MTPDAQRLRLERDIYRGLLQLGAASDLRPFLEQALLQVVEATGAHQGYLALYSGEDLTEQPAFWLAHHCDEQQLVGVRATLSSGIVRAAVEQGQTISTACAVEDPRFSDQDSVALHGIRAVICAPVADARLGVLYLQGRDEPGPFDEPDRLLVEELARQVAPYAQRLLQGAAVDDPTRALRRQLKGLQGLAGRSTALADLFRQVALVAPLDVTVLLTGPSGVGKTALARAIHVNSPRAGGPCVELNCAAIPESLVESELFGAAKGAHSTADRAMEGKVQAADGGTLLLDEVGELPLASQAKLLQFLQERIYYPLGSTRPRQADVRLVVATNRDLLDAVKQRAFREDLYYRLAVLPVEVPPLAHRREDVGPISEALLAAAARRHALACLPLSMAGRAALQASDWPGNVRQLANTVEAGLIRACGAGATRVDSAHLFPGQQQTGDEVSFQVATRSFQRRLLQETLSATEWNVSEAARRLGLSRSHLHELLRGLELHRPGHR